MIIASAPRHVNCHSKQTLDLIRYSSKGKSPPLTKCRLRAQQIETENALHPDALKRRQEAEERARQREAERYARQKERESMAAGNLVPAWWANSPHILSLKSPSELLTILDNADPESLLVICFFNEDCYSCRSLHPKLQSIAASTAKAGVTFVKINGSDPLWQAFCLNEYNISTVPFFHFYKQGKRVSEMSASLNPQRLAAFKAEIEIQRGAKHIIFGLEA